MPERAVLTFYKIEECGYFDSNGVNPPFCGINDLLLDIKRWAIDNEKPLGQTKTFEAGSDGEMLPSYCFDMNFNSVDGSFLLVLWNEMPSQDGAVASVSLSDNVGTARVTLSDLPPGNIPGFSSYFWFLPLKNVYANVKFGTALTGNKCMIKYMNSYMQSCSSHVVVLDGSDPIEILGYRQNTDGPVTSHKPSFAATIYRKAGKIERILAEHNRISKIITKKKIKMNTPEERSIFEKALSLLGIGHTVPNQDEIRFRYEMPITCSPELLNGIINTYRTDFQSSWEDIGFNLRGDGTTLWLSHSYARDDFNLNINRGETGIVNTNALLNELIRNKQEILTRLEID